MADNETVVQPPSVPQTTEQVQNAFYAERSASLKGAPTPKPEVIPEPETVDSPKSEAKPETPEKAEADEADKPAEEDGDKPEDKTEDKRPRRTLREENFRLREQRRAWNTERDALLQQLATKGGAQPEQPKSDATPKVEAKRPRQEDFENYDAYLDARDDWNAKRIRAEVTEELTQKERVRQVQAEQDQTASKFNKSAADARAKYTDYDDVVTDPDLMVTPIMARIVADADNPGELAYWLGQNPQEARRIAGLSPPRAAIELGHIDARFTDAPAPRAPEKPKIPETKAPTPPRSVPHGSSKPTPRKLEELPQQDFYAKRQAQLKGR